jgi:hypothetical protein
LKPLQFVAGIERKTGWRFLAPKLSLLTGG